MAIYPTTIFEWFIIALSFTFNLFLSINKFCDAINTSPPNYAVVLGRHYWETSHNWVGGIYIAPQK